MTCNREVECYSRVVGYFRPVSNWNEGKKSEFKDRKSYTLYNGSKIDGHLDIKTEEKPLK